MSRGTCTDCGVAVMWARTIPGRKMMPLDPVPYPDDDVRATAARLPSSTGDYCRIVTADEPFTPPERRYMPHAATCAARRPAQHARPEEDERDDR